MPVTPEEQAAALARERVLREEATKAAEAAARRAAEVRRIADEARRLDANIVRVLRSNTLGAVASMANFMKALGSAGQRVATQLQEGVDAKGNPVEVNPAAFARLLSAATLSNARVAQAAETLFALESLRAADATGGLPASSEALDAMSSAEVAAEVERVSDAWEALQERLRRDAAADDAADGEPVKH